jgi:hypothetical protein
MKKIDNVKNKEVDKDKTINKSKGAVHVDEDKKNGGNTKKIGNEYLNNRFKNKCGNNNNHVVPQITPS